MSKNLNKESKQMKTAEQIALERLAKQREVERLKPFVTPYTHIIDRTDINQIVCSNGKENITRLQDIQRTIAEKGFWWGRTDLVLVNITVPCSKCDKTDCCGATHIQKAAYYSREGPVGDALDYLTPAQLQEAQEMNRKMIAVVEKVPEMAVFLKLHM